MMDYSIERKKEADGTFEFFLTGFTQAAGLRRYAFQGRVDGTRMEYTVEVNLAKISAHGIRIQDLPLMCRELLQQRLPGDLERAVVFTDQSMRYHAEKLATRASAEHGKKAPKQPRSETAVAGFR